MDEDFLNNTDFTDFIPYIDESEFGYAAFEPRNTDNIVSVNCSNIDSNYKISESPLEYDVCYKALYVGSNFNSVMGICCKVMELYYEFDDVNIRNVKLFGNIKLITRIKHLKCFDKVTKLYLKNCRVEDLMKLTSEKVNDLGIEELEISLVNIFNDTPINIDNILRSDIKKISIYGCNKYTLTGYFDYNYSIIDKLGKNSIECKELDEMIERNKQLLHEKRFKHTKAIF